MHIFADKKQKGVSLIITFFIMIIILAVVFSISALLFSQIKLIKNMGSSIISLDAADSGVEKVLFYDRQVLPVVKENPDGMQILAKRGLCAMYPYSETDNKNACPKSSDIANFDSSLYCEPNINFSAPVLIDPVKHPDGCDIDVCDDCKISFTTTLNSNTTYTVDASVFPSDEDTSANFQIDSRGTYSGAQRQIRVFNTFPSSQAVVNIADACANPKSRPQGFAITISANAYVAAPGTDSISSVEAYIHDSNGIYYNLDGTPASDSTVHPAIQMKIDCQNPNDPSCNYSSNKWLLDWPSPGSVAPVQTYSVDISATDTQESPVTQTEFDINPCNL